MKAFVIGFAVCFGPALAWHMRAVARRWPSTHERLSGPESLRGARPGPDRSQPAYREDHRP